MFAPGLEMNLDHELNRPLDGCGAVTHCDSVGLSADPASPSDAQIARRVLSRATAQLACGLDWPVRLLVTEDESGAVWAVYTDFTYIAHRHRILDREAAFKKASEVIGSVASSVSQK